MSESASATPSRPDIFGHPRGMAALFLTEMWERFSYYGMRALLVLFMTAAIADGGLALTDASAAAIYGLYTAAVYVVALPGGWISDRLLGAQKSVWIGGIVIMLGHFTLAIPAVITFYLGLLLVVIGTGLLKPNISTIVGELYNQRDNQRDAGFTLFYIGINVGGMLGPFICSLLGESEAFGWHWGFGAAGVGMLFGLIAFRWLRSDLGDAGLYPDYLDPQGHSTQPPRHGWLWVGLATSVIVMLIIAGISGLITIDVLQLAHVSSYVIGAIAVAFFAWVLMFGELNQRERRGVIVILILVVAEAVFWSGFEQAGSSLSLFAERYVDRMVGAFEIPTGWFQMLNPGFILLFAPFVAALWVNLGRRNLEPSAPAKFGLGLLQIALGFGVMMLAVKYVIAGDKVAPTWLILTYLFHTTGELCLSPVGLSAVSRLAPKRFVSQMLGIWFLGTALGNLVAGLFASRFDPTAVEDMPGLYLQIITISGVAGIIMLLVARPLQRWLNAGRVEV